MSDFPLTAVSLISNRPATTSLAIAEHFEKNHKEVLRDIRVLIEQCPENFTERNFAPSDYTDPTGRKLPMFHVFFDGFILLVMGYTGPKALKMKLAYIAAFNAMREKLEAARNASLPATPASQLPPAHLATLHAIVDGLVRKSGQTDGKAIRVTRLRIWNSFRTHFGVAKYDELPADKMEEGRPFLCARNCLKLKCLFHLALWQNAPLHPRKRPAPEKSLRA